MNLKDIFNYITNIDDLSIILSLTTLFISFLTYLLNVWTSSSFHRDLIEFKIDKLKLAKELKVELRENNKNSIENYLVFLNEKIKELYPDIVLSIKVLLVKNIDKRDPAQSTVYVRYTYPHREKDRDIVFKIANNTDFSAIVTQKNEFIFISGIKEYDKVSSLGYISEDLNFKKKYNTVIVFPIQEEKGKNRSVIGFVCVASPQRMNNIKKNEELMGFMDIAVNGLSKRLLHEKGLTPLLALNSGNEV